MIRIQPLLRGNFPEWRLKMTDRNWKLAFYFAAFVFLFSGLGAGALAMFASNPATEIQSSLYDTFEFLLLISGAVAISLVQIVRK